MKFKDKVTLVTGGACGLGRAITQCFAREGALVIILDKAEEEAGNTAREIESQGGKAVALKVDATQGQEVINVVDKIAEKWGRIDILVNNIGWNECISFLETDEELWRTSLDINLLIPMRFCRAVLPYMVKQQYGRVVNIASIAGRQPRPMAVTYSAAKAGVISITRSLAVAMAPHNIRVNCIAPALIETELLRQNTPELLGPILKQTTLGRYCKPEEIAEAVLFFASDEASYIVGQSLHVDGGNCML
ncbi:MAG: SDR family NAD(P)-dependent oxidoreductase [Dehalococcoidales bacterium]